MSAALVIGIGNEARGDDVAGLLVARRLAVAAPPGWRVVEHDGDGASLLDLLDEAASAVLADAVAVAPGQAGRILRFDASRSPLPTAPFAGTSTHALGLPEAIELARALGALPRRVLVYGVGAASFAPGSAPRPAVLRAVDAVAARILAEPAAGPLRDRPDRPGTGQG